MFCCRYLDVFFSKVDSDVILLLDMIVCVINFVFSVIVVFVNIFILYVLYKVLLLYFLFKVLLCSFVLLDLGVGVIVQLLFVVYRWVQINGIFYKYCKEGIFFYIEGSYFLVVLFFIMVVISIDWFFLLVFCV